MAQDSARPVIADDVGNALLVRAALAESFWWTWESALRIEIIRHAGSLARLEGDCLLSERGFLL